MSGPDYRHGYLRVPLAVWQHLYCRTPLTRRQLQLVSVILRESWGWQRRGGVVQEWTRPLTTGQFARRTGLRPDRLRRDLQTLQARGVIAEREGCYQLLPLDATAGWGTTLGITPPAATTPPSKRRRLPSKGRRGTALPAHPTPGLKTTQINEIKAGEIRNRTLLRRCPGFARVTPAARLLKLIQCFTGSLTAVEERQLRQWIERENVARVWRTLEPALRRRAAGEAVRALLRGELAATEHP